jgi:hypothetical protein
MVLGKGEPVPVGLRLPIQIGHCLPFERLQHLGLDLTGSDAAPADPGQLGNERPIALVTAEEDEVSVALLLEQMDEAAQRADLEDPVGELRGA